MRFPKHRAQSVLNLVILLAMLISSVLTVRPASASSIIVNSDADVINANDGACTLREAIIAANTDTPSGLSPGECVAGSGADTIAFMANYTITLNGTYLPPITSEITINGNGETDTIIQASTCNPVNDPACTHSHRVFIVTDTGDLTLNDLTVRHGSASGGSGINNAGNLTINNSTISNNKAEYGAGIRNLGNMTITSSSLSENQGIDGGGIRNIGTLTFTDSTISGNEASSRGGGINNIGVLHLTKCDLLKNIAEEGGGIYNDGTLTVEESMFSENEAVAINSSGGGIYNNGSLIVAQSTFSENEARGMDSSGGAIYNSGTMTVAESTLSNNKAQGFCGLGGGIYNSGTLTLEDSTFSKNEATGQWCGGGGIYNSIGGTLDLTNCTLFGNTGSDQGGGIRTWGTLILTNCTLSGNSATEKGGGISNSGTLELINSTLFGNDAVVGGGVHNEGDLNFANTIIASGSGGFCYNDGGTIGTNTHNLVQDGSCGASMTGDPLLGPLADNGGPTLTHALLPGSPAIDAGHAAICAAPPVNNLDQRGVTRPQGAVCDIGAFEFTKLDQVITFTSQAPGDAVVGGPSYTPTAAGGDSGNPILFTIDASAASVCAIDGGQVAFIGAGTCVINANQAGNRYFNAADQSQQSFEVAMPEEEGYALFLPLVVK